MRRLSSKHYPALLEEIKVWRDEAVVDAAMADALMARYSSHEAFNVVGALMIIGAILVGLGVLLFIASNWAAMGAVLKVVLIAIAIGLSYFAGWKLKFEPGNNPKLGTACLLLGSIFYGAAIWLVAQIFNLDPSLKEGLLLWAIGVAPVALITRSVPQAILFSLLASTWMFPGGMDYIGFLMAMVAMIGVASYVRSPWSMGISLLAGAAWSCAYAAQVGLIAYGLGLFAAFLLHRDHWPLMEKPYMYVGVASALGGMLGLTFDQYGNLGDLTTVCFLAIMSVASLVLVAFKNRNYVIEVAVSLALLAGACASMYFGDSLARPLLGNATIISAMACLIYAGVKKYEVAGLVNLTLVFFVLEILARYFDFFFSMMDRSIFFLVGGVVLMVAGAMTERSRRRLVERMS